MNINTVVLYKPLQVKLDLEVTIATYTTDTFFHKCIHTYTYTHEHTHTHIYTYDIFVTLHARPLYIGVSLYMYKS